MPEASSSLPEERFSDRVENYVRYRPGYPPEVPALLAEKTGLGPGTVVADIGSGTGISTEWLLGTGATVFAVEPNAEMRTAAERQLAGRPGFHSVRGTAQGTTLADGSVDLIVAAQAFHWFNTPETRAEFSRILKPGGNTALIWNERKLEATPFLRDYEGLLLRFATDYGAIRHENIDDGALARFFMAPFSVHTFSYRQVFDFEGLQGRLLSSSYAPGPGKAGHEAMLEALRRIFDRHADAGKVVFDYDTRIYLGR